MSVIAFLSGTHCPIVDPLSTPSEMLKLGTRRSDRSWIAGQVEDDDFDPFADVSSDGWVGRSATDVLSL